MGSFAKSVGVALVVAAMAASCARGNQTGTAGGVGVGTPPVGLAGSKADASAPGRFADPSGWVVQATDADGGAQPAADCFVVHAADDPHLGAGSTSAEMPPMPTARRPCSRLPSVHTAIVAAVRNRSLRRDARSLPVLRLEHERRSTVCGGGRVVAQRRDGPHDSRRDPHVIRTAAEVRRRSVAGSRPRPGCPGAQLLPGPRGSGLRSEHAGGAGWWRLSFGRRARSGSDEDRPADEWRSRRVLRFCRPGAPRGGRGSRRWRRRGGGRLPPWHATFLS